MSSRDDLPPFDGIPDPLGPEAARSAQLPSTPDPARVPGMRSVPPAASRPEMQRRRQQALLLSVAWLGAHLVVYGVREDLSELPIEYVLAQIAAPFIMAVLSLVVALSPGRLGLGAAVSITAALAIGGPLTFALMALGVPPPIPVHSGAFVDHLLCLDLTLVWMSVPLLVGAFHLRSTFAGESRYRSALFGAACGLFAGSMMNLHCSSVEQLHMVLGHAIPVGIASLLGGLVVARFTRA